MYNENMEFEWDENKNQKNILKHGISFTEASTIFKEDIISKNDNRKNYGELRKISIGHIENIIIAAVVHTDRNNVIHIISARKANKRETEMYYDYIKKKN